MGGGKDFHYYGKGNTFGQQRKLGDFVFSPTLSGNDHLRTGDIVTGGGRLSLLWQRELVWSAAQARGFRLCSNTVWQRSLTHRQHRDGWGRLSLLWQRELVWSAAQARGFRLCSNTVWQRSLTHRQHR